MSKPLPLLFASDKPSPPIIENNGVQVFGCGVNLKWSSTQDDTCPLTLYTIYYREVRSTSEDDSWYQINVTVDTRSRDLPSLKCNTEYTFKVSAWNELGESATSNEWPIKTGQMTGQMTDNSNGRTLSIAVPVGCGFLILITVGIACFRKRRMKRQRRGHKTRRWGIVLEKCVIL